MKYFRRLGGSEVTSSSILVHLRILLAQVRERIRKETRILEAAESMSFRLMRLQEDPTNLEPIINKYVLGNRRIDAYEALLADIQSVQAMAPDLICSAPPVAAEGPLKSILVATSFLKLEVFTNFQHRILEPLYGRERVETLALRHNMNTVIERGFFCTDVTDTQYNEAIRAIAEYNQLPPDVVAKFEKKDPSTLLQYPTVSMPEHIDTGVQTSQRHYPGTVRVSENLSTSLGTKYGGTEKPDIFIPIGIPSIERHLWEGLMLEIVEATSYE